MFSSVIDCMLVVKSHLGKLHNSYIGDTSSHVQTSIMYTLENMLVFWLRCNWASICGVEGNTRDDCHL